MNPGFAITGHKGFQMTFENGVTVSVQFGPGNYCNRRYCKSDIPVACHVYTSDDAEVAIWDAAGTYLRLSTTDAVKGWCSTEEVAAIIAKAASFPNNTRFKKGKKK